MTAAGGFAPKWLVATDGLHSAVRRAVGIKATAKRTPRSDTGCAMAYRLPVWSDFVEVRSRWGEAYGDSGGTGSGRVAILSRQRPERLVSPALHTICKTRAADTHVARSRLRQVIFPARRGAGAFGR